MPPIDKSTQINSILQEILSTGQTLGIQDADGNIQQFLTKEINGDDLVVYLVIKATLSKDRSGLLVYLLTTAKFVKIEIDKDKVASSSCYLKEITGVNRQLLSHVEGNNAKISIEFPQGGFGLQYPTTYSNIDNFFQKVDESVRKIKGAPSAS